MINSADLLILSTIITQNPDKSFSVLNWSSTGNQTCVFFKGITCDSQGYVEGIRLSSLSLSCPLSSFKDFSKLPRLQYIDLNTNKISGQLEPEWGNMKKIISIDLSNNLIQGSLLLSWSSMTTIQKMNLALNLLQGSLLSEWSTLTSLSYFDIGANAPVLTTSALPGSGTNMMTGTLPITWQSMKNMTVLALDNNQFTGQIPDEFSSFTNLNQLYLYNNLLSGTLSSSFSSWSNVVAVVLDGNTFTSTLPSSWGSWSQIIYLSLQNCNLTGNLPSTYSGMKSLESLLLTYNMLTGPLPPELSALTSLTYASLWTNNFTSTLPPSWSNLIKLQYLYLFQNNLEGTLPSSYSSLVNLQQLWLNNNNFVGELPSSWSAMASMQHLFLSTNQLTSTIPTSWANMTQLTQVWLGRNNLYGTMPSFFGQNSNLVVLDMRLNNFSGQLPNLSKLVNIQTLKLANNKFNGNINSDFGQLVSLLELDLSYNSFEGQIPDVFQNLTSLVLFDVSYNDFVGPLPLSISSAGGNLVILRFSSNNFHGNLPAQWSAFTSLVTMEIDGNPLLNMVGVPDSWKTLQSIKKLVLSGNNIQKMWNLNSFTNLAFLDFSANALDCTLDEALSNVPSSVLYADFSNNKMRGAIVISNDLFHPYLLNISQNSFDRGSLITSDSFRYMNNEAVIDIRQNLQVNCPYPTFYTLSNGKEAPIILLKDSCVQTWSIMMFVIVIIIILGGLLAIIKSTKYSHSFSRESIFLKKGAAFLYYSGQGVFAILDAIFIDLASYSNMFVSLSLISNQGSNCIAGNNKNLFQFILPYYVIRLYDNNNNYNGTTYAPAPPVWFYQDFSTYLSSLWYFSNVVNDDFAYSFPEQQKDVDAFANLCSSFGSECLYDKYSCVGNAEYNSRFQSFYIFVVISISIWIIKEVVKMSLVGYCMIIKKVPLPLRTIVNSSLFGPLLYFRVPDYVELVLYRSTLSDLLLWFLYDHVLENLNQLLINLYFSVYISASGISWEQQISIAGNLLLLAFRIYKICLVIFYKYCSNEKRKVQSKSINKNGEKLFLSPSHRNLVTETVLYSSSSNMFPDSEMPESSGSIKKLTLDESNEQVGVGELEK